MHSSPCVSNPVAQAGSPVTTTNAPALPNPDSLINQIQNQSQHKVGDEDEDEEMESVKSEGGQDDDDS